MRAVALAQLRKLPHIIEQQRKNQAALKEVLSEFDEIQLREVPDPEGDSATFLSFFLPEATKAKAVFDALQEQGIGSAYWYQNNFHFHRQWEHLKKLRSIYPLPLTAVDNVPDYENLSLPVTDGIMQRLVMIQIMVNWSDEKLKELQSKVRTALKSALNK